MEFKRFDMLQDFLTDENTEKAEVLKRNFNPFLNTYQPPI
jgi:hypothetical protein